MKFIFSLFLIFSSISTFSQYKYLILENNKLFFEKIQTINNINPEEVGTHIFLTASKIKDFSIISNQNNIITGKLKNTYIDYKKYGGKWATTMVQLNHPMYADVIIVWKDTRYKVTVTNMIFKFEGMEIELSNVLAKKRATIYRHNPTAIEGGRYLESYISDLFNFNVAKDDW